MEQNPSDTDSDSAGRDTALRLRNPTVIYRIHNPPTAHLMNHIKPSPHKRFPKKRYNIIVASIIQCTNNESIKQPQPPVPSVFLDPKNLIGTLFPNTFKLYYSLKVTGEVSSP